MKKNDLLKRFGERYIAREHDGGYLLYDKEVKARRANHQYKGKFYLSSSGDSYVFEDEYYNTPEELIRAMEEWAASLPFDAEIYSPAFKKSYLIECALHDYLTSLGFKYDDGSTYVLSDAQEKELCTITFKVEDNKTCGVVTRYIGARSWQDAKFTDLDSAIGACNTILSTYCLLVNGKVMNMMSKMTHSRISSFFNHTFSMKTLSTYTEDARQKAIELMEAELKRLKEE